MASFEEQPVGGEILPSEEPLIREEETPSVESNEPVSEETELIKTKEVEEEQILPSAEAPDTKKLEDVRAALQVELTGGANVNGQKVEESLPPTDVEVEPVNIPFGKKPGGVINTLRKWMGIAGVAAIGFGAMEANAGDHGKKEKGFAAAAKRTFEQMKKEELSKPLVYQGRNFRRTPNTNRHDPTIIARGVVGTRFGNPFNPVKPLNLLDYKTDPRNHIETVTETRYDGTVWEHQAEFAPGGKIPVKVIQSRRIK